MRRRTLLGAAALPLVACKGERPVTGGFNGPHPERGHLLRQPPEDAPAVTRQCGVLVVGAGIAGLAAARSLRLEGVDDFAVLDLEDSAGGNSRAGNVGGLPCPLGAHYLPVPGDDAREVREFLEETGVAKLVAGRWTYDERHLCHSPQERLFFNGRWQEGLLPVEGVGPGTLAQYRAFSKKIEAERKRAKFTMPVRGAAPAAHRALDGMTFAAWLNREGFTDTYLRWYLDYCCRDDYGADAASVSAWAGVHYFASRHGFQAPGDVGAGGGGERDALLTWPEGNGWLVKRLADPLADRLQPNRLVFRLRAVRNGVEADVWDFAASRVERWEAARCVVALPLFVAARLLVAPPRALAEAAQRLRYAPWAVANIQIDGPLRDRPGAPPSWDNVLYGSRGLGYVDAGHQNLNPLPVPTVLTWYRPLGDLPDARAQLLSQPWTRWRDEALDELSIAHPDLRARTLRVEVARYGHAMSIPLPGTRTSAALAALQRTQSGLWRRAHFAHADLSGYSVFEEAFTHGDRAGREAAKALAKGR